MTRKKIFVIDDDEELGEEMGELLEAEGYSAEIVSDGEKAKELIRKKTYDIYLLDFKIQGMTGMDLLREIRKKAPAAPVLFVSGRPGLLGLLEAEGLTGAVNEIIEKPFDAEVLLGKIKSCLG